MNAAALIMAVLAIHLGGAGLDSAREATLTRYRDALLASRWELTASPGRDTWTLRGRESRVEIQRMHEASLVYTLVEYGSDPLPLSIGVVSFARARDVLRSTAREGSETIPVDRIDAGWTALGGRTESFHGPIEPGGISDPEGFTDPGGDTDSDNEIRPGGDIRPSGEIRPGETVAPELIGDLHFRWEPGEVTVSLPERAEIFVLQYR